MTSKIPFEGAISVKEWESKRIKNATRSELPKEGPSRASTATRYEYDGKSLTLTEWAVELDLPRQTLAQRLHRGQPHERVFRRAINKSITAYGIEAPIAYWVEVTGLSFSLIHQRLERGLTPDQALMDRPPRVKHEPRESGKAPPMSEAVDTAE